MNQNCAECRSLLGQLGDRDKQLRDVTARAARNERAAQELAEVLGVLDQAGVSSDAGRPHARLTTAARVKSLIERRTP